MITTIFFDIGNVLVGFDHRLIWQRIAQHCPYTPQELEQRVQGTDLMIRHETGELPPQELFKAIQQQAELDPAFSYEEFRHQWGDIFWENPQIIQLAENLCREYTVGFLSNTGEIHWNRLVEQFPLFRRISLRILSFQVGVMKPSDKIYQEAIRQAQAKPEQCVYLDDIPEYASASRELGMRGIHYQTPEQVISELKALRLLH